MARKSVDMNKLGKRIKIVRISIGLTQKQLSERAKITEKYLSNIETGNANCSLSAILDIANALNTSLDHLFEDQLEFAKHTDMTDDFLLHSITRELSSLSDKKKEYIIEMINLVKKYD